jgi:hypothetical protein
MLLLPVRGTDGPGDDISPRCSRTIISYQLLISIAMSHGGSLHLRSGHSINTRRSLRSVEKHFQERASTQRSLHFATPDFLWDLLALIHFMRPSLRKGAHAALSNAAWQEIRVRFGRDDKGEGGAPIESSYRTGLFITSPVEMTSSLEVEVTADLSTTLRSGRDDKFVWKRRDLYLQQICHLDRRSDGPAAHPW